MRSALFWLANKRALTWWPSTWSNSCALILEALAKVSPALSTDSQRKQRYQVGRAFGQSLVLDLDVAELPFDETLNGCCNLALMSSLMC